MQSAPIDTADRKKERMIMQAFYQKHILARLSAATTNLILCCLRIITMRETTKPTRKAMPTSSETTLWEVAQVYWKSSLTKGRRFPRYRQMKPDPSSSMSKRMRGMTIYAETEGMMKLMSTSAKLSAITQARLMRMYSTELETARRGLASLLCSNLAYTYEVVIWMALLANTARKMTDPSSRMQRMQQKRSVHLRYCRGPSLHCTESWMSSSLASYLIFKLSRLLKGISNLFGQGKRGETGLFGQGVGVDRYESFVTI